MTRKIPFTPLLGGLFHLLQTALKAFIPNGLRGHPFLTTPPHHDFVEVVRNGCCVCVVDWVGVGWCGGGLGVHT